MIPRDHDSLGEVKFIYYYGDERATGGQSLQLEKNSWTKDFWVFHSIHVLFLHLLKRDFCWNRISLLYEFHLFSVKYFYNCLSLLLILVLAWIVCGYELTRSLLYCSGLKFKLNFEKWLFTSHKFIWLNLKWHE